MRPASCALCVVPVRCGPDWAAEAAALVVPPLSNDDWTVVGGRPSPGARRTPVPCSQWVSHGSAPRQRWSPRVSRVSRRSAGSEALPEVSTGHGTECTERRGRDLCRQLDTRSEGGLAGSHRHSWVTQTLLGHRDTPGSHGHSWVTRTLLGHRDTPGSPRHSWVPRTLLGHTDTPGSHRHCWVTRTLLGH